MFKSKSNGDIERIAKKFVNVKKTNSDRIKYLKQLIGKDMVLTINVGCLAEPFRDVHSLNYMHAVLLWFYLAK